MSHKRKRYTNIKWPRGTNWLILDIIAEAFKDVDIAQVAADAQVAHIKERKKEKKAKKIAAVIAYKAHLQEKQNQ